MIFMFGQRLLKYFKFAPQYDGPKDMINDVSGKVRNDRRFNPVRPEQPPQISPEMRGSVHRSRPRLARLRETAQGRVSCIPGMGSCGVKQRNIGRCLQRIDGKGQISVAQND